MNLKALLLQAREADDPVIPEEVAVFAECTGIPPENISPHNLLTKIPTPNEVRPFDCILIGGSGEYFVSKKNLPFFEETLDLLRETVSSAKPMYASCFGFQLLSEALGGTVTYDPDLMELGTYDLTLTAAGQADELFGQLPQNFKAQLGHKDRVTVFPKGARNLATSELAPFQAMRIPGKPIWASQFHPELTDQQNLGRVMRYIDEYLKVMTQEELNATLKRYTPSPPASGLLSKFIQLVFG